MIYFDNAATTFPKPKPVLKEVSNCLRYYCGNPGRSSHKLAVEAAEKIYEAREITSDFLGIDAPERIVFTQNATHSLNVAIKGALKEKCHCIISDLEHNSVLRPIYKQKEITNSDISIYNSDKDIKEEIPKLIRDDTKFIITSIASNVTGKIINLKALSETAKKYGLYLIVDASQYLGHKSINLKETPCDILCSSGHKGLFGLQGSGIMYLKNENFVDTLLEGGSGIDSTNEKMPETVPEKYEAGTLSTPSIVGLCAGIKFINSIGIDAIEYKLKILTDRLRNILDIKNVKVYGCENGIGCFNILGQDAYRVSSMLNDADIAVRNGLHCAPLIHKKLGTINSGTVRVSLSVLNNKKQLDKFYKELKRIVY